MTDRVVSSHMGLIQIEMGQKCVKHTPDFKDLVCKNGMEVSLTSNFFLLIPCWNILETLGEMKYIIKINCPCSFLYFFT